MKKKGVLGERRIIEIIRGQLELPSMCVPFGDDVSAWELENGLVAVLKTDMLVDKTDVPPGMSLQQAARKAVVMNVSDFAAKGVKPSALLVSLGLPRNLTQKNIIDLAKGLNAGAREHNCYVLGGDTGETSDLIINISLFGVAKEHEIVLRSGATPGDIVAVTGFFGKTSAGLKILLNNLQVPASVRKVLVESVLMPQARLKEGLALARTGAVSASIDSSDGLAWSLHELAQAGKVGFLIETLPLAEEAERFAEHCKLDAVKLALYGGEEYELVLTVKPGLWDRAKRAAVEAGGMLLSIGRVTARRGLFLCTDGKRRVIEPMGYEHFKSDLVR